MGVVVVTRDRCRTTLDTLRRLREMTEGAPITVVDNASADGTAAAVHAVYPEVKVIRLPSNVGAAGRNCGVSVTHTPYIAFSDDDSWWAPGALKAAADLLDEHPGLAVVAARILVGTDERVDPVCHLMASSPLGSAGGPGVGVLGFIACGAVVRRSAFLGVGGFRLGYGIGGEEELLAVDLRAAGWDLRYCPEIVAHHHPASDRPPGFERRRRQSRNALRTAWLRRRLGGAVRCTAAFARPAGTTRPFASVWWIPSPTPGGSGWTARPSAVAWKRAALPLNPDHP